MKTYTEEEMLNEVIGKRGTPKRESFEMQFKADVLSYRLKKLSKKEHLTEKELTEKISEYTKEALEM